MHEEGDDPHGDQAERPELVTDQKIGREQDRNDRAPDVDGQHRARPVDRDRREERNPHDLDDRARDDALGGQADERDVDIRAEQGREQNERHGKGGEAERDRHPVHQSDRRQNREADDHCEEQPRQTQAQRDVVHVHHGFGPPPGESAVAFLESRDRGDDLLGVRPQGLGVLERAARRPDRDAGPAGQDVEMEVEHLLSARLLVELLDDHAFGRHASLDRDAPLSAPTGMKRARSSGAMSNRLRAATFGITSVWPVRARHDVEEGERNVVLVDLHARGLAAQDFGENVVGIIGLRQMSLPAVSALSSSPRLNGAWLS